MKSSEQLEQQASESHEFHYDQIEGNDSLSDQEMGAAEEQNAERDEQFAIEKITLQTQQAGLDVKEGMEKDRIRKQNTYEIQKLEEVVVGENQERHRSSAEVTKIVQKPLGGVYALMSEAQIAASVEAGKIEAANNVSESLMPQARTLPLVGGLVRVLEKRAA